MITTVDGQIVLVLTWTSSTAASPAALSSAIPDKLARVAIA